MAEYIDREDVYFRCSYNGDCTGSGSECERCTDNVIDYPDFMRLESADVIERSEYEKLRLVNLDLAETNKGLLAEHGQLLKLRSKIDKATEEIKQAISNTEYSYTSAGLELALNILKRNIGE